MGLEARGVWPAARWSERAPQRRRGRCASWLECIAELLAAVTGAPAAAQCTGGCRPLAGDVAELEPCLLDLAEDVTNGRCNSDPAVFTDAAPGTVYCGVTSTYDDLAAADRRDTDC